MIVHVCSTEYYDSEEIVSDFTQKGLKQIEKAVRERNSAGDMTELKLIIYEAYTMS